MGSTVLVTPFSVAVKMQACDMNVSYLPTKITVKDGDRQRADVSMKVRVNAILFLRKVTAKSGIFYFNNQWNPGGMGIFYFGIAVIYIKELQFKDGIQTN